MKKEIENHLNSKDKNEYKYLDKVFDLYLTGDIITTLSKYEGVGIYPTFNKMGKTLQINYSYHNIYVIIDFFEDKYNVAVYHEGINVSGLEKLFIEYDYQDDFNFEKLIDEVDKKIKNHPQLKDTSLIEKKKKLYSIISWISLCLSILFCGSLGLYCIITRSTIKGNVWWEIFFIVIPIIVWFVFDVKSKRLK